MKSDIPLYILAEKKELPECQFMDFQTLEWIEKNRPNFDDNGLVKINPSKIVDYYIKRYTPKINWFENESIVSTIHGQRHLLRCVALAGILCEANLFSANVDELCILASLHDIKRKNDKEDSGHAERASLWLRDNFGMISNVYGYEMNNEIIEKISQAILYHDQKEYPEFLDTSLISLIENFKVVDALDRYRQPKIKWWINEDFLKLKISSSIKRIAFDLVLKSERYFLSGLSNEESVSKAIYDIL